MEPISDNAANQVIVNQHHQNEWSIDYKEPLGKGALSLGVFKAQKLDGLFNERIVDNDGICAIKIIEEEKLDGSEKYEIPTLNRLMDDNLENIVKIYGYGYGMHDNKKALFIYMEYLEGYKSIGDLIEEEFTFNEDQIRKVINDLVYALVSLHERSIHHRDIKGDNILYYKDNIKLIDFSISKCFENKSNYNTLVGTGTHIAPEVIAQNNKASSRSDIWSVGCTIIEMANGDLKKDKGLPIIPNHLSLECKNFIQHCLVFDPFGRLKANELIHHKFLENIKLSESQKEIKNKYTIQKKHISISTDQIDSFNNSEQQHLYNSLEIEDFNNDLSKLKLPPTIEYLSLPEFNQPIKPHSIPSYIHSLSIPKYNHDIEEDAITSNITELILGDSFDFNEYGGNLPENIKKFKCSSQFKSSLKKNNNLPKRTSILVLDGYNYPIIANSIPPTVHSLTLGSKYHHFEGLINLPSSVFNLTIGVPSTCTLSDNDIKEYLPSTISNLIINRQ